jgi:hypothetical protein
MIGASFYGEYNGHLPEHLETVYEQCVSKGEQQKRCVWLAGDSSLDCKYWSLDEPRRAAVNGYEDVLEPAESVADVCYFMNADKRARQADYVCINVAVEATTLEGRLNTSSSDVTNDNDNDMFVGTRDPLLLAQDRFLRDHLGERDVLVVSVGGNDIALSPTLSTILSMGALMYLNPESWVRSGWAFGYGHFRRLFGATVADYVGRLVARTRPSLVVVCMIYNPDEAATGSWADQLFAKIGYDDNPAKLQAAIEHLYESATCQIAVDGVNVTPFPLFRVLDGKNTDDYVARVEPSVQGAEKMSTALLDHIFDRLDQDD